MPQPSPVGWKAHTAGVEALMSSWRSLGPTAAIRLAKPTSNLFRSRTRSSEPGLDVSGLAGVIAVDPAAGTAQVQGMCTYEHLVDVTLSYGFMPLIVPQLRSITLGGAVAGLGIEATSFRHGLPHESVVEMDVLTGAGEIRTVRRGDALFDTFPNSYGSLGYAVRLEIELVAAPDLVALEYLRFDDPQAAARSLDEISRSQLHDGRSVDGLDAVAFSPDEIYVCLARFRSKPDLESDQRVAGGPDVDVQPSDYTGSKMFYRSLQERSSDLLTTYDYLWRWDTDWFWCSEAFGLDRAWVRRVWPRRWRRSDVYHRLVALDQRYGLTRRLDELAGRGRERVIQDVEIPATNLAAFLQWFDAEVGMRPVWLCPLRLRQHPRTGQTKQWPLYPLEPDVTYINVGFWGTVVVASDAVDGEVNRAIEAKVSQLGGHKSLYSDAYYEPARFAALYRTHNLTAVRCECDPDSRLIDLYDKVVQRS